MKKPKGWPSNSDGHWRRAREALENMLLNMKQGERLSVVEACNLLGVSKAHFRTIYWQAKTRVVKLPLGEDGARVYRLRGDAVQRLTDAEASENGRSDANKGRRHIMRSIGRLSTVNTSKLDDGQTQTHRLLEAQMQTTLAALSPQKREAASRKLSNGTLNAGDLSRLFG